MFTDPIATLMILLFLGFAALFIMFIFLLRNIESLRGQLENIQKKLTLSLNDLERQVADLNFADRAKTAATSNGQENLGTLLEHVHAPLDLGPAVHQPAPAQQNGLPDLQLGSTKNGRASSLEVPKDFEF